MSSKPASSSKTTSSSSNVQSTNNKKHEPVAKETSKEIARPPSASKTVGDTQTTPVIDTAAAGVSPGASAAGNGEVVSSTLTTSERPPSANKQLVTTASNENRPASASKQTSEDAALSNKVDPTVTPPLGDATATTANLRPPSGNKKSGDITANILFQQVQVQDLDQQVENKVMQLQPTLQRFLQVQDRDRLL
jgi:hypothetical protein